MIARIRQVKLSIRTNNLSTFRFDFDVVNSIILVFHTCQNLLANNLQIGFGQYQIVFILFALVLTNATSLVTIIWLHAMKNKLID